MSKVFIIVIYQKERQKLRDLTKIKKVYPSVSVYFIFSWESTL